MAYLAHRGWECWAPNLLEVPAGRTALDRVRRLEEICRELPAAPIIIAHDAGAVVSTLAASQVDAPAVVAIAPLVGHIDGGEANGLYAWPEFRRARWIGRSVSPPHGDVATSFRGETGDQLRPDSGPLFRALARGVLRYPSGPLPPGLVVCGAEDPAASPRSCERLLERFGWTLHVLQTTSHFPMLHPGWESVAALVHRWILRTMGERVMEWTDENF